MSKVRDKRLNNEKLRELIAVRQCRFIGKFVRDPNVYPLTKVLMAWCDSKRLTGAPIMTNKQSIFSILKILLQEDTGKNNYGNLSRWIDNTMDNSGGITKLQT